MPLNDLDVIVAVQDLSVAGHVLSALKSDDAFVRHITTAGQVYEQLVVAPPSLLLLANDLSDLPAIDLLPFIEEAEIAVSVVALLDESDDATANAFLEAGVADILSVDAPAMRILLTSRNAARRRTLEKVAKSLRSGGDESRFFGFLGRSLLMQAVYKTIASAARSSAPVFITGESGTGKEVTAEAVHRAGPRSDRPFVALNCAAIPRDLIESELFGHVKGAFTGATTDRQGAAARASDGTLFLDELAEMPIELQAKLLRFLQTGRFSPVGGNYEQQVDARIVAATNQTPHAAIAKGRLREDLFYRLYVVPIELPPLREREADAVLLAEHFLLRYAREERKSFQQIDPDAAELIRNHRWPGNVRELQNAVRQAVVMHDGTTLTVEMLRLESPRSPPDETTRLDPPSTDRSRPISPDPSAIDHPAMIIRPLKQVEREAIETALEACGGNVARAAAYLEIAPSTLYRKQRSWSEE